MALQCSHHIKRAILCKNMMIYIQYDDTIFHQGIFSLKMAALHKQNKPSIMHISSDIVLGLFDCTHVENTRSLIRTRCDRLWCSDLHVPRTFPMQDYSDFTRVFLKELLIMECCSFSLTFMYYIAGATHLFWSKNVSPWGSCTIRGRLLHSNE